MIGFLRLALALGIMVFHLTGVGQSFAIVAVIAFYALAGYFGAKTMTHYAGKPMAFLASRYLRIWPSFAVVFVGSSIALNYGWTPRLGTIGLPSIFGLLTQFLLIPTGASPVYDPFVVATSWMLPLMLIGWACLAVGLGATPKRAILWACGSGALLIALQAWPWTPAFFAPWYVVPWFAVGAVAAHRIECPRDGVIGSWAGELSYPLFLLHHAIGAAIPMAHGWPLFFAALPPTLTLSWLLVVAVERPVQTFRSSLRGKSNGSL